MAEARLRTRADLDATNFDRGIAKMKQGVTSFGSGQLKQMAGMVTGAFAAYKVVDFAKKTLEAADRVDDLSKNLRVLPEELQALELIAARSGSSVEGMDTALERLQKSMNSAAAGNPKMVASLKTLGLTSDFIAQNQNNMGAVFEAVSRKVVAGAGDMQINEAAGAVLGKQYVQLNDTMQTVATQGLSAIRKGLIETNEIMSNDSIKAAAMMQESYERLGAKMKTSFGNTLIEMIGGLKAFYSYMKTGNWDAAAEDLFGKPKNILKTPAELAAEQQNKNAIDNAGKVAFEKAKAKGAALLDAPMKVGDIGAPVASDQYARMGLFSGGNVSQSPYKIAERQLKVEEEIRQRLDKANELLEEARKNTAKTAENLEE